MFNATSVNPRTRRLLIYFPPLFCCIILSYCFFDPSLPLRNDTPECTNYTTIEATLNYPDSSICTLYIDDKNDKELTLSSLPCSLSDSDGKQCDTRTSFQPWPGSYYFLTSGYSTKKLHLILGTNRLGLYKGILRITDQEGSAISLPYKIRKFFLEPFDETYLSPHFWHYYKSAEDTNITFDYTDKKLAFSFKKDSTSGNMYHSTGIRSAFTLSSSFAFTIGFELRDEMNKGFEAAVFISDSPDTGRWVGSKAGISIIGKKGWLDIKCRSVFGQFFSKETQHTTGFLGISRRDSTLLYIYHDGNPLSTPDTLIEYAYPSEEVYVHLKMSVDNTIKERTCYWNDFIINSGIIHFN